MASEGQIDKKDDTVGTAQERPGSQIPVNEPFMMESIYGIENLGDNGTLVRHGQAGDIQEFFQGFSFCRLCLDNAKVGGLETVLDPRQVAVGKIFVLGKKAVKLLLLKGEIGRGLRNEMEKDFLSNRMPGFVGVAGMGLSHEALDTVVSKLRSGGNGGGGFVEGGFNGVEESGSGQGSDIIMKAAPA
jgi:hypothetical protein